MTCCPDRATVCRAVTAAPTASSASAHARDGRFAARDNRRRRGFPPFAVAIVLALLAALTGCATRVGTVLFGNEFAFSTPELQQSLERRFPRDYEALGGLATVRLMNPRLSIPPAGGRVRVDFDVGFGGPRGGGDTPDGRIAVTSALRYDPATRGLHLLDPSLERVEIPALGGVMNDTARGALNRWLVDYARNEPIHRFDDSLLARIGARRISGTRIEPGRVVIQLGD
jgi:hypothetical protein